MLIKNIMHLNKQLIIKKQIKKEIEKNKIIIDDFIRFYFILSFKRTNIFFSFFSLHLNKYNLIKKKSCGLVNRRNKENKQIKKRKMYKTKLDFIFEVYNDFFNTFNFSKLISKKYKSFIFLKFKIFFFDYKSFILIRRTINIFKNK